MVVIQVPLYISANRPGSKKYYLNLNNYRNWHYQVSNNLKVKYKEMVAPQLEGLSFKRIGIQFILFWGSKRRVDRANVLSIHEKFFCDALVEAGCIEDDNDTFLEYTHYTTGGIDRENPRCEIWIEELG